ncbi:MAG TPA: FRG domain-containing protein [Candidatus Omnitrophota bacterium]|nr:FRG domain-containing protein [Candidatus Omnitrophota bacterium]
MAKVKKIKSVLDFVRWMSSCPEADMYRGELNAEWLLLPSIVRYAQKVDGYDDILGLEEHLILEFEKFSVPFNDCTNLPYIQKLVHAQHYGVPTRLLDWTSNPLKALYFAVENPDLDKFCGIVHVVQHAFWCEGTKHVGLDKMLDAFYPEILNERISAQDGCFISFPLSKGVRKIKPLNKVNYPKEIQGYDFVIIEAKSKREIRRELSKLGISHRTIYPGLEGVGKWTKSKLADFLV